MKHWLTAGALVLVGLSLLAGCANPKYVAASTGRSGEIKFLYVDQDGQGLIKCARAADGALSNCRTIDLVLNGE